MAQRTISNTPEWTIGDRIRKARQHAGMDLRTVAEELGFTHSAVHHWESGKAHPHPIILEAFAKLTGVSPEWLIGDYKQPGHRPKGSGKKAAAPAKSTGRGVRNSKFPCISESSGLAA